MNTVVGIICEYDPFHLGHKHQFKLIRARFPNAKIVCLMSGCFTQRGMLSLHTPAARAHAALHGGADLVLELPAAFALRDAENFALGGVHILSQLGFITHLCFGAEDDTDQLLPAARLLEEPTSEFASLLKSELATGISFAAAQGNALAACLPQCASLLNRPNNTLALCYLRALIRLKSTIVPFPVKRVGGYHDPSLMLDTFPSATAVRHAFLDGDTASVSSACGYKLPASPICKPDALDPVLLYRLRSMTPEELSKLPLCTEGLENRLFSCARDAATREGLIAAIKTKRYTHARLSRLCCHAMLSITSDFLADHPLPEYVRLLGFKKESADLLSLFNESSIPVISKAANADTTSSLFVLDTHAYDLWALGASLPAGLIFTQSVVIV
ncbi:MAG: nucleotidyltransferase family protein [Clostridiales bacterium]|nr:nucleotidyltransferase family protein [Clostridiales bacterium]